MQNGVIIGLYSCELTFPANTPIAVFRDAVSGWDEVYATLHLSTALDPVTGVIARAPVTAVIVHPSLHSVRALQRREQNNNN